MKMNFKNAVAQETMSIEETLKAHEPYAALVVSTTGLDDKDFDKHGATRVQCVQFEFDDENSKQYQKIITFDYMVAADKDAVQRAIDTAKAGGYDAFGMAGIDADAYQKEMQNPKSDIVLSPKKFEQTFSMLMQSLQSEKVKLLVNGADHAIKYLDKIGCADALKEMRSSDRIIDQSKLNAEYLSAHGQAVKYSATLEAVRNVLMPLPAAIQRFEEPQTAADFLAMSKEDFLKAHKEIQERAYNMKVADNEKRAAKIPATERIGVMHDLVTSIGREKGFLESERMEHVRQQETSKTEFYSSNGKQKYQNASIEGKLRTQIEMGKMNPDAIMDGNSEYQKLMDVLDKKNGNKGVALVHIATSGLKNGSETGLPLQLCVRLIDIDDNGNLQTRRSRGATVTMKLPEKEMLVALEQIKKGDFDVFKDAGIDVEKYQALCRENDPRVEPIEKFIAHVERCFPKDRLEEYPIIALSKTGDKAFFQSALQSIGTLDVCDAPVIDFVAAIKEYSYLTLNHPDFDDNVIFGDSTVKNLGIRDVADAIGLDATGVAGKLVVMGSAISKMREQYLEMNAEHEQEQTAKTAVFAEDDLEEGFADEDKGYGNTVTDNDVEQARAMREAEAEAEAAEAEAEAAYFDNMMGEDIDIDDVVAAMDEAKLGDNVDEFEADEAEPTPIPVQHKPAPEERKIPAPNMSNVVSIETQALITALSRQSEIIAKQSEMITHQSEIIAQQDARLFDLLQQQNEMMRAMIFGAPTPPAPTKEPRNQKVTPLKAVSGGNPSEPELE